MFNFEARGGHVSGIETLDALHEGAAWTPAESFSHALDRPGGSPGSDFDAPIAQIPHRSREPEFPGSPAGPPAEPHALDAAVHDEPGPPIGLRLSMGLVGLWARRRS